MIEKLFGKNSTYVVLGCIFIVGGLTAVGVIDQATGVILLSLLGIQGSASEGLVKK
jgi:hypothetical protein